MTREIASLSGEWPDGTLYVETTDDGGILFWTAGDDEFTNIHTTPEEAWDFAKSVMEAAEKLLGG